LVEVGLLALFSVIGGIAFAVLRRGGRGAAGFWMAACGSIFGAGVCQLLSGTVPHILTAGHVLTAFYPALILAGALSYARRRVPRWLLALGLLVGTTRALAAGLGGPGLAQAIGLAFQPTATLLAAVVLFRLPRDLAPRGIPSALAPALVGMAVLDALTLVATPPGSPVDPALLRIWVLAVPLVLALQVAAAGDRARLELQHARDRLEQRVTERTAELARSLAALRESEARHRTISALSWDYSFAVRFEPDLSMAFDWVTDRMTEISGYRAEDVAGASWISRIPSEDREAALAALRAALAGERDEMELRIVTRAGDVRWLALRFGARRKEADGVVHVVGAGRDVTELKRAEEERRRLDAIVGQRQHVESLGLLAGGLAHDFSNVLTVIRGNTHLAREALEPGSPAHAALARIESATEYAVELADQLLTYSGRASAVLRPLDLSELVRGSLDLMRASIAEKNRLDVELADELPPVRGDATQLRQVLLNLVGNASEAIPPEGGRIEVRTALRTLGRDELAGALPTANAEPGRYAMLEVSDTGPGIEPEVRARIFEPFFTTRRGGRGLGLAAVFGIVSAHRGILEVDSTPGSGTAFRVLLPVAAAPDPAARGGGGGPGILLVDDDEGVLDLGRELLSRAGFRVWTASGGRQAVEWLGAHPDSVEAVVLDLVMPEMDGAETLRALRRIRPSLPVVVSSGRSAQPDLAADGDAALSIVRKPYEPAELIERVREAVGVPRP
jgi:PAS domain S-box-containing protein